MSKYIIESNVPVVVGYMRRPKSELRLAIEALEVGQSFAFDASEIRRVQQLRANVRSLDRSKSFVVNSQMRRIWRVEAKRS